MTAPVYEIIIDRNIVFLSPVDEDQKVRVIEIVKDYPASKNSKDDIKLRTFFFKDNETPNANRI